MRSLSARDLIQIWEWGEGQHPVDRALILLSAACPEMTWEELVALSVGQRDALLLVLRELTFGPRLDGFAECPQCRERLEFAINVADLCAVDSVELMEPEPVLMMEGFELRFRLPNSLDLAAVARCNDVGTARDLLVRRCVSQAHQGNAKVAPDALPEAVITALATRIAECDPLAEVQLDLICPGCDHRWPTVLDIVSFFWAEISDQVKRLLRQVHVLAQAYGWREADILALSARRRQLYLEMVT